MYICNIKLNRKIIYKITFGIFLTIVLLMLLTGMKKIFRTEDTSGRILYINNDNEKNEKNIKNNRVNKITAKNYANVLKTVHENIDDYVGMKIEFSGFVYRIKDFNKDQFVLGRQMIISKDMQAVVVGFLCNLNEADKYRDGQWIKIEGTITKGDFKGEMPIIKIEKIEKTEVPNDEYVYPPDENYIPTSSRL